MSESEFSFISGNFSETQNPIDDNGIDDELGEYNKLIKDAIDSADSRRSGPKRFKRIGSYYRTIEVAGAGQGDTECGCNFSKKGASSSETAGKRANDKVVRDPYSQAGCGCHNCQITTKPEDRIPCRCRCTCGSKAEKDDPPVIAIGICDNKEPVGELVEEPEWVLKCKIVPTDESKDEPKDEPKDKLADVKLVSDKPKDEPMDELKDRPEDDMMKKLYEKIGYKPGDDTVHRDNKEKKCAPIVEFPAHEVSQECKAIVQKIEELYDEMTEKAFVLVPKVHEIMDLRTKFTAKLEEFKKKIQEGIDNMAGCHPRKILNDTVKRSENIPLKTFTKYLASLEDGVKIPSSIKKYEQEQKELSDIFLDIDKIKMDIEPIKKEIRQIYLKITFLVMKNSALLSEEHNDLRKMPEKINDIYSRCSIKNDDTWDMMQDYTKFILDGVYT